VLFVDARNMGKMVTRALRELDEKNDIKKIADTFEAYRQGTLEDEAGFCAVKTLEDIKAQDYVLTPGRYVGIAEQEEEGEPFVEKMQRLTTELSELLANGYRMDAEIKKQLSIIGFEME
jgi:type I restriction enzyme M protein